jgi:hypothetical protein
MKMSSFVQISGFVRFFVDFETKVMQHNRGIVIKLGFILVIKVVLCVIGKKFVQK